MMMFFVLWTILLATFVSSQEDACFTNLTDPFQMLATATPHGELNVMDVAPVLLDSKYYNVVKHYYYGIKCNSIAIQYALAPSPQRSVRRTEEAQ